MSRAERLARIVAEIKSLARVHVWTRRAIASGVYECEPLVADRNAQRAKSLAITAVQVSR